MIKTLLILSFSLLSSLCLANSSINLSDQERQFIKDNPVVVLGSGESFEPFIFKNENGVTAGYDREIANLIEQKTGLTINFEFGLWSDIQASAAQGEIDGLSTIVITKERQALYNFSTPYLKYTAIALVNRANHHKIYKKEDVQHKKAAVQRGNIGFELMTKALGSVEIVYYDDIYSVLHAVVNNEVDFTILDESVYYLANKLGVSDFISTSFVVGKEQPIHFALSNKKPLLVSIINKALDDINPYQFADIKTHWFDDLGKNTAHFSAQEKQYLYQKKTLKFCINPDFYPIESIENGKHLGVSADFIKLFQHQISIPFQLVQTNSWSESLLAIKNGQCDLLPMAMKTPQLSDSLRFTPPYLLTPLVIATKSDVPFIQRLESLNHKSIGIIKGNAYSKILQQRFPQINIVEIDTIQQGFTHVENGELFGFFGALANISHQFQKGYSSSLKITGRFDEKWQLSVATQKEDEILHGIFNKLIATIDDDTRRNALNKYISINYESFVDYSIINKMLALFFIILLSLLLWNQRIQTSKKSLDKRYEKLEVIKNKIQENEARLKIVMQHGHIGNWEMNVTKQTAQCSLIHDQIFGYSGALPDWTYALFLQHVIPEDRASIDEKFKKAMQNKQYLNYECRILRKDGAIRWIVGTAGQEFDSAGNIKSITGIIQDITERKRVEIDKAQHHAELQSIFNALPDIYFRMRHDGTILDYHAQQENNLFLNPEDFIGKRMQHVLPPQVGEQFQLALNEISQARNTLFLTYELEINNQLLHFEARLNRITYNNQIVCVIRDMTEDYKSTEYLAASEQRFRMIFEQSAIGVVLSDAHSGKFIHVNQCFCDMLGYSIEEMLGGIAINDITHPNDLQTSLNFFKNIGKGQDSEVTLEKRYLHKDGHIVWAELTISPGYKIQHKPQQLIAVIQDISERKKSEEKLKLAANVFTHAAEGIMITNASGTIIDVNETFTVVTGYNREEAIGQNPSFLSSGRQSSEFYKTMWHSLLEKGHWSGEVWNRRKDNEIYAEMLNISSVRDARGKLSNYVGLFSDITLMKKHQSQLEHTASYDLLTNLPNRSLLADRLSQAMLQCSRQKQSVAVVFLDLDSFKVVNDTHGHDVGDNLLIALSARMREALREVDTLARIGGDEFVAVLADLERVEDCEPVLKRLLQATSEPIILNDIVLNMSSSIGVTLYPQDNVDADMLMRHADQAMYAAKASGKNCYHLFNTAQDDAVKAQRESLDAIRYALDNQQFLLHYQPKVNMRTGTVIGVEALIRWQHPERGLLNPIQFLPAIENSSMSIELGEWVMHAAMTQISQWQQRGLSLPVSISVNIAAAQLQQPDFSKRLASLLLAFPDVEPHFLELEVLETSALDDVQHVSKIMNACRALGVNFALDDFGTGYSSLTYLRRLPANLIKIDQSFVRDMLHDVDDLAIVEGVIALANSFKRDVIAEGVETIEHGTALLQLGCELAQGYGIAKPMPAADVPEWVNNWKPDASWQSK